jgi:hypothetical protein
MSTPKQMDPAAIKRAHIERTLRFFHSEGAVIELCALNPENPKSQVWSGYAGGKKGVIAGWFDDRARLLDMAMRLDASACEGIYITINPCDPALLARSKNKLKAGVGRTNDSEIASISKLLIDIDPQRPQGISSTDAEHDLSIRHAGWMAGMLSGKGWPKPLLGDSGNGAHLVYRLEDLPNTTENIELIKAVLQVFNKLYMIHRDGITLDIDQKVFNPARISKLYGTMARKGDSTEERPHRMSRILEVPDTPEPVTVAMLRELLEEDASTAGEIDSKDKTKRKNPDGRKKKPGGGLIASDPGNGSEASGPLDLARYLDHYGIAVKVEKANGSSTLHVLHNCVFDPSHSGGDAAIGQMEDGKLFYQCFHNSCQGRTWAEAREIISGSDRLGRFMPGYDPHRPAGSFAPPAGGASTDEIMDRVNELNQTYAVIMLGGKCSILHEAIDPTFDHPDLTFMAPVDFKTFFANEKYWITKPNGQLRPVSIGELWIESPARRQYNGLTFNPTNDTNGYYNLFKGFAVKPREGDWSKFRRHIFEVIANGDEATFKYVLAWMAHLVQEPGGERPGTCIVLRGKQGTGKGCFVGHFGSIFGQHYLHITNAHQITGRFNNHLKNSLLVFCDEGTWGGDKATEGILKGLITEDALQVEPKGKDVFTIRSHLRMIVASNNNWVVPAGMEERRFFVTDVGDKHIQDKSYFTAIHAEMHNGGRAAMLHDLMQIDISGYDLKDFPRMEPLRDQIISSMSSVQKFWLERLRAGTLLEKEDRWEAFVITRALHNEYLEFCKVLGDRYPKIDEQFTKALKSMCQPIYRNRVSIQGRREWVLQFPPIWDCRDQFELMIKMKMDWEENRTDGKKSPYDDIEHGGVSQ